MAGRKFYSGTGRRKRAISRVWLTNGGGEIKVNAQTPEEYFGNRRAENLILKPFELMGMQSKFDASIKVMGGGKSSQLAAIIHGVARALYQLNPERGVVLKKENLLRRDPREKERKKYGRHRARRGWQYARR